MVTVTVPRVPEFNVAFSGNTELSSAGTGKPVSGVPPFRLAVTLLVEVMEAL